ncbi:hypothetical protein DFH06DRAFT_1227857 [Mycena polygramma]|nr:hypothetical protein DFH06DRAFT_1227857 [Mycena polygramma]
MGVAALIMSCGFPFTSGLRHRWERKLWCKVRVRPTGHRLLPSRTRSGHFQARTDLPDVHRIHRGRWADARFRSRHRHPRRTGMLVYNLDVFKTCAMSRRGDEEPYCIYPVCSQT